MRTFNQLIGTYSAARTAVNDAIEQLNGMTLVLRITCIASLFMGVMFQFSTRQASVRW